MFLEISIAPTFSTTPTLPISDVPRRTTTEPSAANASASESKSAATELSAANASALTTTASFATASLTHSITSGTTTKRRATILYRRK